MDICQNSSADGQERRSEVDLKGNVSSEFSFLPNLQQSILEERKHLQVYLRIRPFTSAECNSRESQDCVSIESEDTVLLKPPSASVSARLSVDRSLPQTGQRFQFSQVFGPQTTQQQLFEGTVKDLVKDVLHGQNSLLFTYGVTNAGKTFTFLGPEANAGILPRSLDLIFNSIDERVFTGTDIKPQRCRDFTRLSTEQQLEEAAFKRNLFRQLKESDRSNVSILNSSTKTVLEGTVSMLGTSSVAAEDKISLKVAPTTKFSVWVSFCEIYNENIHDLLEALPSGAPRRTVLRLSQDVKGNTFVKDLRWVQVTSTEEAFKVMKFGKKNQSFSSTRINQVSSRSHSVFSIRVLKIEDAGTPRVHTVSELCLCDLAGSERCTKTQNRGERLKEAGNINTSMLILGKCINALRHNQQSKLLQHVPFRESKLTHYLQSFFCGRGKACMIVNINQCASMYDETLNVLKFSAVAQKVVVLTTKPLPAKALTSASEVCTPRSRRSSLDVWESSLEDVQEDMDSDCEDEDILMETTVDQSGNEEGLSKAMQQVALFKQLQLQLKKERAEGLLMEARVREEISREFSELFSDMQKDYNERLAREREILEERAERRMEIFKNLIDNMTKAGSSHGAKDLDKSLDLRSSELAEIKMAAEAACKCLGSGGAVSWGNSSTVEGQKWKMSETQEEQTARKRRGETSRDEEEECKQRKKSSQISQAEDGRQRQQLQEALSALEKEKKAREDVLAALEFQTLGKEEALACAEKEREAKEEALVTVRELRRERDEAAAAALAEVKPSRDDREKARSVLDRQIKISRLVQEKEKQQQQVDALQQEVRDLTSKLDLTHQKVTSEEERVSQASLQLQSAQEQLDQRLKEIQEKNSQIHSLKQELQAVTALSSRNESKHEVSEIQRNLADHKENSESRHLQMLEHELLQTKTLETINDKQDASGLQVNELITKLQEQKENISTLENQERNAKEQTEQLRLKLEEQKENISTLENQERNAKEQTEQLRLKLEEQKENISTLENQERNAKEQTEQLRTKLQEQKEIISTLENQEQNAKEQTEQLRLKLEEQVQEVNKKLQKQQVESQKLLEELKHDLKQQQETSDNVITDLKQKFCEEEKTVELLRTELEEALLKRSSSSAAAEEELKRSNSELQAEVASMRSKVADMEEGKALEAQSTSETERCLQEKLAASEKVSADMQKKLQEMEAQLTSQQKSLKKAQELRDQEELQAVQEARQLETERRRELLVVAHEAIAQKDEELEKRVEEISRLKENAKQDLEKVTSLGVDLQRKEDEVSDMREKLADYKKQIQQIQKEISVMREDEKLLRQKLSDAEKARKQLQCDVASRDRSIQQLRAEQSSNSRSEQNTCKDLEAKERVMEDMRLALTEQEETQSQMEEVLEEKLHLIQELCEEVESLKAQQGGAVSAQVDRRSHDVSLVKQEAAKAQEQLKLCTDKHQAERRKWLEEKLSLIGQVKEAEDKRNQEMRKFVDDRERYMRQQSRMESELSEKEQTMDTWRTERDTLVSALEVQLHKLLSSQAEKDKEIQELRRNATQPPAEAKISESPAAQAEKPHTVTINRESTERRETRASVSSQCSTGFPSVLESSEISTENGRTRRFPRPELEISFSPLQPNRMALRRQGDDSAVTVKITRSARKRKSSEMEKEEVEAENRRNKVTTKLTPHKESSSPAGHHDSRSRKEGTLHKIGDFLQSSPTLLSTKAKKMVGLMSGRSEAASSSSSSSLSLRAKKNKRKLYKPDISSPIDLQSNTIISLDPEERERERESDHQIIKRRLRSRILK